MNNPLKAIIVEDEFHSRETLKGFLGNIALRSN